MNSIATIFCVSNTLGHFTLRFMNRCVFSPSLKHLPSSIFRALWSAQITPLCKSIPAGDYLIRWNISTKVEIMLYLQSFSKEAEQENFDVGNPFLIIPVPFSVLQDTAVTEVCDIWLWQSLRLIWRPLNFIILFHTIPTDPAVSLYLLWPAWGWCQLDLVAKGPEQELEPVLQLLCFPSCTSQRQWQGKEQRNLLCLLQINRKSSLLTCLNILHSWVGLNAI